MALASAFLIWIVPIFIQNIFKSELKIKEYQLTEEDAFIHNHSLQESSIKTKEVFIDEENNELKPKDIARSYDISLKGKGEVKSACFGTKIGDELDIVKAEKGHIILSDIKKFISVVPNNLKGDIIFHEGNIIEDDFLRGYLFMDDENNNNQGVLLLYDKGDKQTSIIDINTINEKAINDVNRLPNLKTSYITNNKLIIQKEFNELKKGCTN